MFFHLVTKYLRVKELMGIRVNGLKGIRVNGLKGSYKS